MSDDDPQRPPLIPPWITQHWVALTSVTLTLYLVLSLFRVARGDWQTAVGLVEYADPVQVAMAAVMGSARVFIPVALIFLVIRVFIAEPRGDGSLGRAFVGLAAMMALAAVIVPVPWVIVSVVLIAAWLFVHFRIAPWWRRVKRPERDVTKGYQLVWVALVLSACAAWMIWSAVPDRPWLMPSEIHQNGTSQVAYVLEETTRNVTVLTYPDHRIETIPTEAVESITVCRFPDRLGGPSIAQVIAGEHASGKGSRC